ncbi:uncharacterized protein LOC132723208 [Ruditapes philippinarum]|uniref:uncharacterized protein LOC132723208 n=1 Tax=Ruditapes philippinarum TaxID=129788 RepID=UPI00295A5834|nr:uncharacterized protein LOC132723208 [Ruditapes philippinarum]
MGAKQSTGTGSPRVRTYSSSGSQNGAGPHMSGASSRARARSLGSYTNPPAGLHIPVSNGSGPGAVGGSPDSDSSPDESAGVPPQLQGLRNITHSLPLHLFALHGEYIVCDKQLCKL